METVFQSNMVCRIGFLAEGRTVFRQVIGSMRYASVIQRGEACSHMAGRQSIASRRSPARGEGRPQYTAPSGAKPPARHVLQHSPEAHVHHMLGRLQKKVVTRFPCRSIHFTAGERVPSQHEAQKLSRKVTGLKAVSAWHVERRQPSRHRPHAEPNSPALVIGHGSRRKAQHHMSQR